MTDTYQSWGRYPKAVHQSIPLHWTSTPIPDSSAAVLAYGRGRSYGDCCLNDGGVLLDTASLDRFIAFDPESGILRAESGVMLADILRVFVPRGWFLPVTPGTKYVSLGGAVANDVHGKNHHRAGTFGDHIRAFELVRSDGSRRICTPQENADWFRATIAGLGLTGLITWVEIQLIPIQSPFVNVDYIKFGNLTEFLALSKESDEAFDYTVSWLDTSPGRRSGRGIFMRGNPASRSGLAPAPRDPVLTVRMEPPTHVLNRWTMSLFNSAFYHKQWKRRDTRTVHYDPFFYPLDGIAHWNRLYGKAGFLQFQCVLPPGSDDGIAALKQLLRICAKAGEISFLTVLKKFGDRPAAGWMSFPRKGLTLSMDFPIRGTRTFSLLDELDGVVRDCGGAIYPAKDARMPAKSFQHYYPRWKEFSRFIDPRFSSSFWRRVSR